jgi:hypothetical protein
MRTFISRCLLAILLLAPVGAKAAQNSATRSASVLTTVTDGIALARTADLDFGSMVAGSSAGLVTVSSSGTRATTGGVSTVGGGFTPASFTVSIQQGNPNYAIQLPVGSTNLNGSAGGSMVVDSFESTPGGSGHVPPPIGFEVLTVGATLHVGANQVAGIYSGTFNITVTRQ